MNLNRLLYSFLFILFTYTSIAQDTAADNGFQLFINCNSCDMTFIRNELDYLNHVRDQALADAMIQINRVRNASGGNNFEFRFIGFNAYEGLEQTLELSTQPMATSDEVRRSMVSRIELGLVPYLVKAGMVEQILVEIDRGETEERQPMTPYDPWNFWIFEVYGEGELEKESFDQQIDIEAGFSADRITEEWRIQARAEMNYFQRRFENDEQSFKSFRNRHFVWGKIVKSLGPHWSVGIDGSVRHDTYDNVELSAGVRPGIEYSLFPYRDVIRREITFAYYLGSRYFDYVDKTVYEKETELLWNHALQVNMRFRQPWGDVFTRLEASQFLHDLQKNRVELFSRVNVRVWKGLAVRFSINLDLIRDQLSLPAEGASVEDILLRQRQIATNFSLGIGGGLSYTFGSAFNNVINTRL